MCLESDLRLESDLDGENVTHERHELRIIIVVAFQDTWLSVVSSVDTGTLDTRLNTSESTIYTDLMREKYCKMVLR